MVLSSPLELVVVLVLGLAAGTITTISGFGGGLLLTATLVPWLGPSAALAVAAPALLIGHVHRAIQYRAAIDAGVARRFAFGAVPGALLGASIAASVPEAVLGLALLLGALLAGAQAWGWIPTRFGERALIPGAGAVGFLAGSCGGGGVLLPPTLMSVGLSGRAFVATAATGAMAVQVTRVASYAVVGMIAVEQVPSMAAAGLGLLLGNTLGRRLAVDIDAAATAIWTRSTLAVALVCGLWGLR